MSRGGGPRRVRFAPSPTGSLHLGNARTALFNWLVARRTGGTLILRIEDTDRERHEAVAEAAILDDLRWLGLDWDEGPDRDGGHGPYRQSERTAVYAAAAERLLATDRAYRCTCEDPGTEREVPQGATASRCPCADRPIGDPPGGEAAVRFRTFPRGSGGCPVGFPDRLRGPIEVPPEGLGDPVILRRDGRPTYNFAVVVDDAAMDVDLVIRGDDHLSNTPRQVLMFEALGHTLPEFAHLPMVRGADGSRLSKRHGAVSVGDYRRRGYPVAGLVNALALLGWAPQDDRTVLDRDELLQQFDLDRVNRSAAAFDSAKLDWISNQHIQRMPAAELAEPVAAALVAAGRLPERLLADPTLAAFREGLAALVQSALEHFDQAPARAEALFARGGEPADPAALEALLAEDAGRVVAELARLLGNRQRLDLEGWRALKKELSVSSGARGKALFHPVRVALTGATSGPELDRLVPLICEGHALLPEHVPSLAERAARTAEWLG